MVVELKVIPEEQRAPNPLLDASWRRVDRFSSKGPQPLNDDDTDKPTVLHGSKPARIDQSADYLDDEESQLDEEEEREGAALDEEGEWEYEEDEVYVTLDLGDAGAKQEAAYECAISGLESRTPYLVYGRSLFKGEWDTLLGSEILLHAQRRAETGFVISPLSGSSTVTRSLAEASTTQHRLLMTPMVRKPDAPGTKPSALAGFRYFAHLEADAERDKVQKKAPGERTYEERWMTNVAAALKRREKLARRGVELDPTKSTAPRTKRSTTAAELAAEVEELGEAEAPTSSRRSAMRGARTSTEEGELASSDNSQARSSRRTRTAGSSRLGPAPESSRNSTDEQEEPESSGRRRKPSRRTRFESDDVKGEAASSGTDS